MSQIFDSCLMRTSSLRRRGRCLYTQQAPHQIRQRKHAGGACALMCQKSAYRRARSLYEVMQRAAPTTGGVSRTARIAASIQPRVTPLSRRFPCSAHRAALRAFNSFANPVQQAWCEHRARRSITLTSFIHATYTTGFYRLYRSLTRRSKHGRRAEADPAAVVPRRFARGRQRIVRAAKIHNGDDEAGACHQAPKAT